MLSSTELIKEKPRHQIIDYTEVQSKDKSADTVLIKQGQLLYNKNCLACHGSFSADDGPWLNLSGYPNHWPDKKELFSFVKDPDSIMKVNTCAKALIEKFAVRMKGNPDLSDKEIESIFFFIDNEKAEKQVQ